MTKLSNNYNLQKLCPGLVKEWHPSKNRKLKPEDVTPNSGRRVWWLCSKNQNHEWQAIIGTRNIQSTQCPYCSGRIVCEDNCLQTINPSLAKEWHPTKNGTLTPRDVTSGSGKKVWWLCSQSKNHEWKATIDNRNNGNGCPHCYNKRRKEMMRNSGMLMFMALCYLGK